MEPRTLLLVALAVLAGEGCARKNNPAASCSPGATQVCHCVGGGNGVQVCNPDGASWGPCQCLSFPDGGRDLAADRGAGDRLAGDQGADRGHPDRPRDQARDSARDQRRIDSAPDMPRPDAPLCKTNADCADPLPCTTDLCTVSGCVHIASGAHCVIGGICVSAGTSNPSNPCRQCDPGKNGSDWSDVPCVTTLAGTSWGYADGPASSAQFKTPSGVAADGKGNVYVADTGGHRIRLVAGGQVSTLAGNGTAGFADGPALSAQLNSPSGVAVDSSGNVYFADRSDHRIRKVAGGLVTTLAGDGTFGFADGAAASARFYHPQRVLVTGTGSLYVTDGANHRIRAISAGQVTTIAVLGPNEWASGMAVDGSGKIYVATRDDPGPHGVQLDRIRVVSSGMLTTFCGSVRGFADGPLASALFSSPSGLALEVPGKLYVADPGNTRIRLITF